MKKQVKEFFCYLIITSFMMMTLTGCSVHSHGDTKTIEDKTNQEITYLEDEILTIVNRYSKREYNSDNGINWDEVSKDVEQINNSLDTILLDLSDIKISNEDLINFRNETNNLNIAITKKDEYELMQRCSYLYSLLPGYLEKSSGNNNEVSTMKLKSLMVSSFVQANFYEWENAKTTIGIAETKYKEMMDDVNYMKDYSYNLNKIYILIEEMKNTIDLQEADLTRIKYINFIEKI